MTIARLISFTTATLASPLLLGVSGSAAAQARARHGQESAAHAPRPSTEATKEQRSFTAIAGKLNTSPDALKSEYDAARQANPKLTRGQFIAANLLAKHLAARNPSITTQAMLDGLNSGKTIGTTLESFGLSQSEATAAQRAANREIREAELHARASSKAASETKPDQDKPQNR